MKCYQLISLVVHVCCWLSCYKVDVTLAFTASKCKVSRSPVRAVATTTIRTRIHQHHYQPSFNLERGARTKYSFVQKQQSTLLHAVDTTDLEVISLVVGQANYGLAIVCVAEGIWSFLSAPPSISNAIRVVGPNIIAAIILVALSGPMITSLSTSAVDAATVASSIGNGLYIASAVTIGLGINYLLRLFSPFPDTPKEIAFLGLLVAVAGFFTFSQNLIVNGFITLPSIDIQLPSIF
jgi:hypothetical protein